MSLLRRLFRRSEKEAEKTQVTKTPEITKLVTFIGLGFVGKTTILQRLRTGEFHGRSTRTMGLNVDQFTYRDVKFQAFDLGGQEAFHMIWSDYLQLASAVVFVVDCSDPKSFEASKEALYNALPDIKPNGILLLAANKADLSGVDPYVLLLQHFDLYEIQQKGQFKAVNIFHMSAKSGVNFYQAFDWLIETLTGEMILPKIKVHNVCIYQTESGLLVGTSAVEEELAYDPSMLTSMFSAVNTFAQASLGAGVREILMKRTGESEIDDHYKLVRVEDADYSVILIVDESDSMRKSIKIGKDLLNWTRIQRASTNALEIETIDE
ncbi:MAG: GTP-binding protein, partial [Candidatus Heimdallarchaeota archaeon]|nr:GTP-binding protein [Candidatus Heimdallarchaeota archaeon]